MRLKSLHFLAVLIIPCTLIACAQFSNIGDSPSIPVLGKTGDQKEPIELALYYVKFTDHDSYLAREIHQTPYTEDVPKAAIQELLDSTPLTEGAFKILPSKTKLLGITVTDGLATVNFSKEVLTANVGSSGETLGIQSVVNTLTEIPEIREVSFQVEGLIDSRTRDWWGHVGLYEQPFKRNLDKVMEPSVWVTHPVIGQTIGVPLLIKGSTLASQGTVISSLLDSSGKTITQKSITIPQGKTGRTDFEMELTFNPTEKGKGTLLVNRLGSGVNNPGGTVKIPIQWP